MDRRLARLGQHDLRPLASSSSLRDMTERIDAGGIVCVMPLHWFSPPVYVATKKVGERYAVSNVERAAEFLLSWRGEGAGELWRQAVSECMAAIKGQTPAEEARSAFEAAAQECGQIL